MLLANKFCQLQSLLGTQLRAILDQQGSTFIELREDIVSHPIFNGSNAPTIGIDALNPRLHLRSNEVVALLRQFELGLQITGWKGRMFQHRSSVVQQNLMVGQKPVLSLPLREQIPQDG
jgi:hypothetical protein